jgi:hypothetical protein
MIRRLARALWALALLLSLLTLPAAGCRKKASEGSVVAPVTPAAPHWPTPLMTPPPPVPTPTLWRTDITRIPTLPG